MTRGLLLRMAVLWALSCLPPAFAQDLVPRAEIPLAASVGEPAPASDRDTSARAAAAPITSATAPPSKAKSGQPPPAAGTGPAAGPLASLPGLQQLGTPIQMVLGLTVLAMLPALLVCLTSFLRIVVVLSMLRHAIGLPETPPNVVLIGMALLLTSFTMAPVWTQVNGVAVQPFLQGKLDALGAVDRGIEPLRSFMLRQTREADIALMSELAKSPPPASAADVPFPQLTSAFIVSELRAAFQIGFVIFLPFLLIDLLVSSILMALGMMMMPPVTIALPLKILMFVLVDGWSLLLRAIVGSFH